MTNRFPIVLDTQDGNRLKEIPSGDNLDLAGSSIVNASSIETVGNLSALSITVNGETLGTAAFSNDYNDLENLPTLFDGDYQGLANKPDIPSLTKNLDDVSEDNPVNGDALIFNSINGKYEPKTVLTELDLSNKSLNDLSDTLITGIVTDRFLKFTAGAWRPARVQYSEVQNKPTNVSFFTNDAGYLTQETLEEIEIRTDLVGSVFADDSSMLVDGGAGKIIGDVENTSVITSTITGNSSIAMVGANTDSNGGSVTLAGGIGATGNGGNVSLAGGVGSGGDGGDLSLTGGIGSNGEGGSALLAAGNGSTDGGDLTLGGGTAGTGAGGEVLIYGGTGNTDGGRVRILGGNGLVNGGDLLLWAGSGVTGGGTLDLRGGAGAGNVTIDGGAGEEGSTQGSVLIGTTEFTESVVINKAIITGDVTGSVFADDSTLLVDGVNGEIPGYVKLQTLKDITDQSVDFNDFKTRIANL